MKWKAIGQSVAGHSHHTNGKGCEDVVQYGIEQTDDGTEVLICAASDGAGSAKFAAMAAGFATNKIFDILTSFAIAGHEVAEKDIFTMVEDVYEGLSLFADIQGAELNEYSCTLLGCYLTVEKAVFFQIGDGAIVRNDGTGYFTTIWWPQNGEYQNTTSFIVDDARLGNLKIVIIEGKIDEVALFTDGLQLLALSMESQNVHQPFFNDMFQFLRQANTSKQVGILNEKLEQYLNSDTINSRTDDDKTLFMASRLGDTLV